MDVPRNVLGCVLAMCCAAANAQSTSAAQSIDITASRLRGADLESASPVQVLKADDIQRRGVASLRQLLDQLSIGGAGLSDISGYGTFAPGSSAAALRGLGSQSTLVLLNSRRVAPYPLANYAEVFTNIDALPFEAIERIEILKSGASALYGSDAVAGVINIITRKDWTGLQVRASHERSLTSGYFGDYTASITAGIGTPNSKTGHLLANIEMYRRDGLIWRDIVQYADPAVTSRSPSFGSFSSYSWPGNVIGSDPVPGCMPELFQGGLCRYDRYKRFEAIPASERVNLLLSADMSLKDGRRVFGELLLADTLTTYHSPFQPYGKALSPVTWGDPDTGSTQTFRYRGLPATHPLNTAGVDNADFRYRFVDGPSQDTPHTLQYRALAGLGGIWRGFEWETAGGVMGGRTKFEQRGWFSLTGFHELIGNDDPATPDPQFFNRAYRIGQVNSPDVLSRLFPTYGYRGRVEQWFVDGKMTGTLNARMLGPINLALGAELRHERYTIDPSAALRAGDIVGNGLSASDASRWVGAAFAEGAVKLGTMTELQAAARVDQYGSLAPRLSPKLSVRIQPSVHWVVRGSAEAGFRAPNLVESADSTKFAYENVPDPRRCPQAQALALDLRAAAATLSASDPQRTLLNARADSVSIVECQGAIASIVRNNPDLKPETSRSLNLGIVFSPGKNLTLSADAWDIHRRNEIGLRGTNELLNAESDLPAGTVNRLALDADPTFSAAELAAYGVQLGALRSVVGRFDNLARTQARGVDVAGKAVVATPLGKLELLLDGTYLVTFRNWSATRAGWGDNLAGRNGHPRWNLTTSATLHAGAWAHTVQAVSYPATPLYGDYFDTTYTPENCAAAGFSARDCTTPGHTRWDYALRYTGWRQWTIGINLRNVPATRVPTNIAAWLNAGGILPPSWEDARGRSMRVTLEWRPR